MAIEYAVIPRLCKMIDELFKYFRILTPKMLTTI